MLRIVGATTSAPALGLSTPAADAQYSEARAYGARRGAAFLRRWQILGPSAAGLLDAKAVVPARIGAR